MKIGECFDVFDVANKRDLRPGNQTVIVSNNFLLLLFSKLSPQNLDEWFFE